MGNAIHRTIPVKVWVDVDVGISGFVELLNTIPDVRTLSSCQGTIGEGGAAPYEAEVHVTWANDQARECLERYNLTVEGCGFGVVHPQKIRARRG